MLPSVKLRFFLVCFLSGLLFSQLVSLWISAAMLAFSTSGFIGRPQFWVGGVLVFSLASTYVPVYSLVRYHSNLNAVVGHTITMKGVVVGEPRVSRNGVQTVRLKMRPNGHYPYPLQGHVLWQGAPWPLFQVGDEVHLQATVSRIGQTSTDFDAVSYWERWGISHALLRVQLLSRSPPRMSSSQAWREEAIERLHHHLNKPHSTIASGMLMGLKEKLPRALETDFKTSGLQHLLVVSGTNVTLLVFAVSLVLKSFNPWLRYLLTLVILLFYLHLVGFDPPALRASIFGGLIGLALTSGFNVEARNLLLSCAVVLCLFDPFYVISDVSFWLSFSATAGIFVLVPWLDQALKFIRFSALRLLLAASLAAQVSVFPILILVFGSFPYVGLLTNLFSEPLVPLIMFLALGLVIIGPLNLLGLEMVWAHSLEASISFLIFLAQTSALFPQLIMPTWTGLALGGGLIGFGMWASFSPYYQRQVWEPFEARLKN